MLEKKLQLRGDRFTFDRVSYYGLRAITRLLSTPVRLLPEGPAKMAVRRQMLKVQHSLPTEVAVNSGDTVMQIGTPWPSTMRRFRKAIGPGGRLVIMEAMPENADRLERAIREDGYSNVHVFRGAAWSERKTGSFLVSPHDGDHKIKQDDVRMDNDLRDINRDMKEVLVEFHRIDDVMKSFGLSKLDYLSVTVNGAELEVLKGAEETLRKPGPMRVYSKGHALAADDTPINVAIIALLNSYGFTCVRTRGEPSSTIDSRWRRRAGDVFAWKG